MERGRPALASLPVAIALLAKKATQPIQWAITREMIEGERSHNGEPDGPPRNRKARRKAAALTRAKP